jgi:hypothetical protein
MIFISGALAAGLCDNRFGGRYRFIGASASRRANDNNMFSQSNGSGRTLTELATLAPATRAIATILQQSTEGETNSKARCKGAMDMPRIKPFKTSTLGSRRCTS